MSAIPEEVAAKEADAPAQKIGGTTIEGEVKKEKAQQG